MGGAGAYEVSLISDSGLPAVGLTRGGDEAVVRLTGFGAAGVAVDGDDSGAGFDAGWEDGGLGVDGGVL